MAPAPRAAQIETFANGAAAVTLDSGLTLVFDAETIADLRRAGPGGGARLIRRHGAGDPLREEAIRAVLQDGSGARRGSGGDPLSDARPLGAGLSGDLGVPAAARETRVSLRPGSLAAERDHGGLTARNSGSDTRRRAATRSNRTAAAPTPPDTPGAALRAAMNAPARSARATKPGRKGTTSTASPNAGPARGSVSRGLSAAPALNAPSASLLSSSLPTTVTGPDPVASPSGLSLR